MTDLQRRVREILKEPTGSNDDKVQRRIRWTMAAEEAIKAGDGDLVEIGAYTGDTTVLLCGLAKRYGRRVVAIDPWKAPSINCAGWEYDEFMKRTETWRASGILSVIRRPSQDVPVVQMLIDRKWAFALVDGQHKFVQVMCDIMAVRNARIICADDMNDAQVQKAYDQALALLPGRLGIYDNSLARKWEGYLV